jgi:glycosyltransferase involved in cell wall biosynthesis
MKNQSHSVSVIIPNKDTPPGLLTRAINSALNQTYSVSEIIIIDDASSIPFSGVQNQYPKENIKWVVQNKKTGVASARNLGVDASSSHYVSFLDSDDYWDKDKLEKQVANMCSAKCRWSYVSAVMVDDKSNHIDTMLASNSGYIYKDLLKEMVITGSSSSVTMEKSFFNELGGFEECSEIIEDWDLWLRASKLERVCAISSTFSYINSYSPFSRSANIKSKIARLSYFQNKYKSDYKKNKIFFYTKSYFFFKLARLHLIKGNYFATVYYFIVSLVFQPKLYINKGYVPVIKKTFYVVRGRFLRKFNPRIK